MPRVLVLFNVDLASCILVLLTEHLQFANCSLCSYFLLQTMHWYSWIIVGKAAEKGITSNFGVGATIRDDHVVLGLHIETSGQVVVDEEVYINVVLDWCVTDCCSKACSE